MLKKASVDKKALEGEAQEIADDLKMVEYDLISGKGYLSYIKASPIKTGITAMDQ